MSIELDKRLKKLIKKCSHKTLIQLYSLGQLHNYDSVEGKRDWNACPMR